MTLIFEFERMRQRFVGDPSYIIGSQCNILEIVILFLFYLAFDQYIYLKTDTKNIDIISLKYYIQHWSCCARTGL